MEKMLKLISVKKLGAWGMIFAMLLQTFSPFISSVHASDEVASTTIVETVNVSDSDTETATPELNEVSDNSQENAEESNETSETTESTQTEETTAEKADSDTEETSAEEKLPAEPETTDQEQITKKLKQKILALVAKELGVDLENYATFYAKEAGIEKYRGTADQNELLKSYLIENRDNLPTPPAKDETPAENQTSETSSENTETTVEKSDSNAEATPTVDGEPANAETPENTPSAENTSGTLDKSNWPSMIADRSNEGEVLNPDQVFRNVDDNTEGKINLYIATKDKNEDQTPKTEYYVGERIKTYATVAPSGKNFIVTNAKVKITFPKRYITNKSAFVKAESASSFETTEDSNNRYVTYNFDRLVGGTQIDFPIFFEHTKNSSTPNGFETPIKMEVFDEWDQLLNSITTTYKAKTLPLTSSLRYRNIQNWDHRRDVRGEVDGKEVNGVIMKYFYYEDELDSIDSTRTRPGGSAWVRWQPRLVVSGRSLSDNVGTSRPSKVKVVAKLPPEATMHGNPKSPGVWNTSDYGSWDWRYDPDTHTATYEWPIQDYAAGRLNVSYPSVLFTGDDGQLKKYPITFTITENPGTDYARTYEPVTMFTSIHSQIIKRPPPQDANSRIDFKYEGSLFQDHLGIFYEDVRTENTRKPHFNFDFRDLHDTNHNRKEFYVHEILFHTLDPKMYYDSIIFEDMPSYQGDMVVYGIKEDDTEVELGRNYQKGDKLEINDTVDQYKNLKIRFEQPLVMKNSEKWFRMDIKTPVKDQYWEEIKEKYLVDKTQPNWSRQEIFWPKKMWHHVRMMLSNSQDATIGQHNRSGYMYYKKDWSRPGWWNGNSWHSIPYGDNNKRRVHFWVEIMKDHHDVSWTAYARENHLMKSAKLLSLLPMGIEYVPGSVSHPSFWGQRSNDKVWEPEVIRNYKNTWKTAVIFDLWDISYWRHFWHRWRNSRPVSFEIEANKFANDGNNIMDTYLYRDKENSVGLEYTNANHTDVYDLDGNGDTKEKFVYVGRTNIEFIPAKEVVLRNTLNTDTAGSFTNTSIFDIEGDKYYKIAVFNNSIRDTSNLQIINVLPYQNDHAITPDKNDEYLPRNSEFVVNLKQSLESVPANQELLEKWDILYSTSNQGNTLAETRDVSFVPADQIKDFSQVKMIRMVQKPWAVLREWETANFYVPIDVPKSAVDQNMLTAVTSSAFSTNGVDFVEGNKAEFQLVTEYRVDGKVFIDQNNDGAYAGEQGLENYTVKLMNADGSPATNKEGQEITATTDGEGNYFMKVFKRGEYYLTLAKKVITDEVAKLFQNESGDHVVGSEGNDATLDNSDATNATLRVPNFSLNPFWITSRVDFFAKPSSMIATRNFGLVPKNGKITLTLTDSVDPAIVIPNAEFQVKNTQGQVIATLTTDAKGQITTDLLPFGEYTFVQTSTTANYMVNTEKRTINLQTYQTNLTHTNTLKKGGLNLKLVDDQDETIVIKGGTFELRNAKGELVATLTTNEKGELNKPDLPYGKYTITQISTAEHYVVDPQPKSFTLTDEISAVLVKNPLKKGNITITLADVKKPDIKLAGGVFEIYNKKGERVGEGTTNEYGQIIIQNLPYGEYQIKQKIAPKRYKIITEKTDFGLFAEQTDISVKNRKKSQPPVDEPAIEITPRPEPTPVPPVPEPTPEPKPEPTPIVPEMPDPIIYRTEEPSKPEPAPIPTVPAEENTKIKKYVKVLPKTGVLSAGDLQKKAGISKNAKVETNLPKAETFRLAGSTETNLAHWLSVLPKQDQKADQFIVLPKQGLVMPVHTVAENSKAYNNFINGKTENFLPQLHNGWVQLPGTSLGSYGQAGNKVIAGHSSYWKHSSARYKTHFQKIIGMEKGEQIWIYQKTKAGTYQRFVYSVDASYNTADTDISVLKPTANDQLTLMTCTPIGGVAGRWIVKAAFLGH